MAKKHKSSKKQFAGLNDRSTQAVMAIESKPIESISIWEYFIPPFLLSFLTLISYYPSLSYPFQFDDLPNITKKFDIRFLKNWSFSDLLSPRWFGDFINRLNYQIGRFDSWYYRSFNLLMHIISGVILFFLLLMLFRKIKHSEFLQKNALLLSFLTAALFLLHPVQTQTISYVIQARLEGLAVLFIFMTILFFIQAARSRTFFKKLFFTILFMLAGAISCGTKEIVIISPFLLILVDWFFIAESDWKSFRSRLWMHLLFSVLIFGIFLIHNKIHWFSAIFGLKYSMTNNRGNILTKNHDDIITPLHYLISEFKVILHYLFIFIWPFDISVEYDWKLSESFFAPDSFFPFITLCGIFFSAIFAAYKKILTYFAFGILWFFVAIAPRSSIIPSSELICDYKTYLASFGWLLVLAAVLTYFINFIAQLFKNSDYKSKTIKIILFAALSIAAFYGYIAWIISNQAKSNYKIFTYFLFLVPLAVLYFFWHVYKNKNNEALYSSKNLTCLSLLLVGFLGYATMTRNTVWESSINFWTDIVQKAPMKARGHNNLGVALSEGERFEEAMTYYKRAIQLDSHYSDPWSNIAVAYSMQNKVELAIEALHNAIRILPYYPEAYNNLGTLYLQKKQYDLAERNFNIALHIRPYYGKAFFNLARLYIEKGDFNKAWQYVKNATEGDMDNITGFHALGELSLKVNKYPESIVAFKQAIALGDKQETTIFNLGNAYFMNKQLDDALNIFNRLASLDPKNVGYLYNLGETYFVKGDYNKALEVFNKVNLLPDALPESYFRYVHCLVQLSRKDEAKQYLTMLINSQSPSWFCEFAKNEMVRLFNTSVPNPIDKLALRS